MSQDSDQRSYAMRMSALAFGSIILMLIVGLTYRDCQNTDDRIMDCIKAGQSAVDCSKTFNPRRLPQ